MLPWDPLYAQIIFYGENFLANAQAFDWLCSLDVFARALLQEFSRTRHHGEAVEGRQGRSF